MNLLLSFSRIVFFPIAFFILLGFLWSIIGCRRTFSPAVLFCEISFCLMFIWRLPLLSTSRYLLPLIVPGLVLVAFVLKQLYRKGRSGHFIVIVLLIALMIGGMCKALRPQENKEYLTTIHNII